MSHPLDDPRAKLRRAEEHLKEFEVERKRWIESGPYAVLPYMNADQTKWTARLHRMDTAIKAERDVWGLIIGDYIHNLRSALDHLVWQLVTVANGITPTDKTESSISFPVVTISPRDFWSRPMIQREDLTLEQALMIEGFQPYRAIGMEKTTPLADLHALWNADKHKLITPIKVTLSAGSPPVTKLTDVRFIDGPEWDFEIALEGDADIGWATIEVTGSNPQVDVNSFAVDVTFGEGGRLIQNMTVLYDLTRDIVENCAHFFK